MRELFNTLEEALAIAGIEPTLYPHHLPTRIRAVLTRLAVKATVHAHAPGSIDESITGKEEDKLLPIHEYRHPMERRYLERLNRVTKGNRKKACQISALSRTRLFELLKNTTCPCLKENEARPIRPLKAINML